MPRQTRVSKDFEVCIHPENSNLNHFKKNSNDFAPPYLDNIPENVYGAVGM